MEVNELQELLGLAKKELDKANNLLGVLKKTNLNQPNENVKAGLEAIETYIQHADEIIKWLK